MAIGSFEKLNWIFNRCSELSLCHNISAHCTAFTCIQSVIVSLKHSKASTVKNHYENIT